MLDNYFISYRQHSVSNTQKLIFIGCGAHPTFSMQYSIRFIRSLPLLVITTSAALYWGSNSALAEPALSGIILEGTTGSLNPAFDSNITRYSAIANVDDEAVSITPSAIIGTTIEVNGLAVSSGTSVNLSSIAAGENIQVTASQNGEQTTYEIIYLPSDFPQLSARSNGTGISTDPILSLIHI